MKAKYLLSSSSSSALAGAIVGIAVLAASPQARAQAAGVSGVVAALRADNQILQENQRKLVAALEETRQLQVEQAREIANLKQEVAALKTALNRTEDAWQTSLKGVEQALREEGQHRQSSIKEVVNTVKEVVKDAAETMQGRSDVGAAAQGEYVVQRGDTLSAIAKAFNVKVSDLKKANNMQKDFIREGQKLVIPSN